MNNNEKNKPQISLYIHIPFCVKKCNYCDFLSFPASDEQKTSYLDMLCLEIERKSRFFDGIEVSSVFIGGGTPSCIPANEIAKIMELINRSFALQKGAEVTIEVNPGTVDLEKLSCYLQAGINRLSIGLQSTDDAMLQILGRIHNFADFAETYKQARKCGFENISVDLMSGLPGQTTEQFLDTLKIVTSFKPEHISCYSLILEEGTLFYEKMDSMVFPSEDEDRDMYAMTKQFLHEQGYERYEISNYAKKGKESRHNIGYWKRGEYLGLGLGAASHIQNIRFNNPANMEQYFAMVNSDILTDNADGSGRTGFCLIPGWENDYEQVEILSVEDRIEEYMFLGLRMMCGINTEDFSHQFGKTVDDVYGSVLQSLISQQLITKNNQYVALTERGIDVSNYVFGQFLFD